MNIPLITAAHFSPGRGGNHIQRIYIHTMETPESEGRALQVTQWFAGHSSPQASAHYCVDDKAIYQAVKEEDTAWAVDDFSENQKSISIELAGTALQSPTQWMDPYSSEELQLAATLVAELCDVYGVEIAKITPAQINQGVSGIAGHLDVTLAKGIRGGHTDPGGNFPWARFIQLVKSKPPVGVKGV